jgi:hypothetical protein
VHVVVNGRQGREPRSIVLLAIGLLAVTAAVVLAATRLVSVVSAASPSTQPVPAVPTTSPAATRPIPTSTPSTVVREVPPSTGQASVPPSTGQASPTTSMYRPPRPGITFTASSTRVREGQTISVAGTGCAVDHVTTTVSANVTSTLQARVWVDGFALGGDKVYPVDPRGDWHGSFRIPERDRPRPANAVGDSIVAQCERMGPNGELLEILIVYYSRDLAVSSG